MKRDRLDDQLGASVTAHDGKVVVSLWLDSRRPPDDPLMIDMTPGEALDLIGKLAPCASLALQRALKTS
jgi:hypothetical protein